MLDSQNKKKYFIIRVLDFLKLYRLFEGNVDAVMTDKLTGLYRREVFYRLVEKYLSIVKRHNETACVIIFDLNKLKETNDKFGHKAGDKLIADFAEAIKASDRDSDISCRWGGDEFVSVIDGDEAAAEKFAGRVIASNSRISFAYGVSLINGYDVGAFENAVKRADKKMYQNKLLQRETA